MKKPIVALMYDFDKTLCTKDMQEYGFIPSLGMSSSAFWGEVRQLTDSQEMDNILAYMYKMVEKAKEKRETITRETFKKLGEGVEYFDGVDSWFERINAYGEKMGVRIEHYIVSSGIKEIIEGTKIALISRKSTPVNLCMITPERFSGPNMLSITPQRHNSFSESIKAF